MLDDDEVTRVNVRELKRSITQLQEQLASMKPNMAAIAEYREKNREFESRMEVRSVRRQSRQSRRWCGLLN